MTNKFYSEGKFFDTFEEVLEYSKKWNDFDLDTLTADRHLDRLKKDITMNIFMRGIKFTNSEFIKYINSIFEFAIKTLPE